MRQFLTQILNVRILQFAKSLSLLQVGALLILFSLTTATVNNGQTFGGSCPKSCNCSGTKVDCQGKSLSDVPPNIPANTTILNLRNNLIQKLNNGSMKQLGNLLELYLADNKLTEITADGLEGLKKLMKLYLDRNQLEDFPELGDAASSLTHLGLTQNSIKDKPLPSSYSTCSKLKSLILTKNSWSTINESTFQPLSNSQLQSLKLNSAGVSSIHAKSLDPISPKLMSLDLSDNPNLKAESLQAVFSSRGFALLTSLILKQMSFTELPAKFLPVGSMPRLNILHLDMCTQMTKISKTALTGANTVTRLYLNDCKALVNWEGSAIDDLSGLKELNLGGTGLTTIGGRDGKTNSLSQLSAHTMSKAGLQISSNNRLICNCDLKWLTDLLATSNQSRLCVKDLSKIQIRDGIRNYVPLLKCHPKDCNHTTTTSTTSTTTTTTAKTTTSTTTTPATTTTATMPTTTKVSTTATAPKTEAALPAFVIVIITAVSTTFAIFLLLLLIVFLRKRNRSSGQGAETESCLKLMWMRNRSERLQDMSEDCEV